jgi:hypothetical protein
MSEIGYLLIINGIYLLMDLNSPFLFSRHAYYRGNKLSPLYARYVRHRCTIRVLLS